MRFNFLIYKTRFGPIILLFAIISSVISISFGYRVDNNPYKHREVLGLKGEYVIEWLVDLQEKLVTFNVSVETKGFIGFGLSSKPQMDGADLVVGGVLPNGKPYLSDRHIVGRELVVDESQDYILLEARESTTHTFLSFSRAFDTCDANDLELKELGDSMSIIWAYGEDDDIGYHFQNRGTLDTYVLDADLVPREILESPPFGNFIDGNVATVGNWRVWTIAKSEPIPVKDTAYICSIHKSPKHNKKQHMIGFRTILEGATERRHIHHFVLRRCRPPPGISPNVFFGSWLSHPGEECYVSHPEGSGEMPAQYCEEIVHVWGPGGKPNFHPSHVGQPLTEESPDEYFLIQIHYDNRDLLPGLDARFSLQVFYTENLRKYDAGLLLLGTAVPGSPSILIPPGSTNHTIYGHCASGCTNHIFPREGINIFAAFQHTHLAGRGLRSNHIRNGRYLPPFIYDDNYNFNFQQIRTLNEERNVLPGDSLVVQCTYDTTDRFGNVTIGGFRTSYVNNKEKD